MRWLAALVLVVAVGACAALEGAMAHVRRL